MFPNFYGVCNMYDFFFHGMSAVNVAVLMIAAVLIGVNKTGIPGLGLVPVVILTLFFPAGFSTGLQLLMLCAGDVMAVSYYRRTADWKLVFRLLPCTLAGLVLGSVTLHYFGDAYLKQGIGIIILLLSALNFIRRKYWKPERLPENFLFSLAVGLTAGFTTQVANAAGPVMALYLLAMRLPKEKYVGTAAWYFLIMNWIKLPVFICEGRITKEAFLADLPMLPFIILGAWLGTVVLKKLTLDHFERIIEVLVLISAVKLLF